MTKFTQEHISIVRNVNWIKKLINFLQWWKRISSLSSRQVVPLGGVSELHRSSLLGQGDYMRASWSTWVWDRGTGGGVATSQGDGKRGEGRPNTQENCLTLKMRSENVILILPNFHTNYPGSSVRRRRWTRRSSAARAPFLSALINHFITRRRRTYSELHRSRKSN